MSTRTGGVASAFGFRYQYLITAELLLERYESGTSDWSVDVDRADQDSADILVFGENKDTPEAAIQVKASLEASSTTLGLASYKRIVNHLRGEHPLAQQYRVVTNRNLTQELSSLDHDSLFRQPASSVSRVVLDHRIESLHDLAATLLTRIEAIRRRGPGGVGDLMHHLILRHLVDLVHERGARDVDQRITRADVAAVLNVRPAVLAEATGARRWGATYQLPQGRYVERAAASLFLEEALPLESLLTGHVKTAVIRGLSGIGKSSAAALFASGRLEHYAFVVWLDARSEDTLRTQVPDALAWLGAAPVAEGTAPVWTNLLSELPVPWLVVLDGADDPDVVRKWTPPSGYGHVIVTTRLGEWAANTAPVVELCPMDASEAEALLRARLDGSANSSSTGISAESCHRLIERLAGWPLALEYAASWLRIRGRGAADLSILFERLDRLDLNDPQLGPDTYPATATGVIRNVWESLSPPARLLLSGLVMMHGRAPTRLLGEWVDSCGGDAVVGVRELAAFSLTSRLVVDDRRGPHEFDEALQAHDAVRLVIERAGLEIQGEHLLHLVTILDKRLRLLLDEGRFIEATSLVLPTDGVLQALLTLDVPDKMRLMSTILMHSLGMTATMVSLPTLAERWLTCAVNVRDEVAPEDFRINADKVVFQLQTLGALGQVVAQGADQDKLRLIAAHTIDLLHRHPGIDTRGKPSVAEHLVPLTHALCQHDPTNTALPELLGVTAGVSPSEYGPGGQLVAQLQSQLESARRLAQAERWTESVNTALAAANDADARGVLVGVMADGLLSVAAELVSSVLRRPHVTPRASVEGLRRLTAWLEAVEEATPSQAARINLLRSIATLDPDAIEDAIRATAGQHEASTPLVAEWVDAAKITQGMLRSRWLSQALPLDDLPPGMCVLRTIDGGRNSIYWPGVHGDTGMPIVIFCTSSVVEHSADGTHDPLEAASRAAGLVGSADSEGLPPVADGWTITAEGGPLILRDAEGTEWLTSDDEPPEFFLEAMATSTFAHVIYADLGETGPIGLCSDRPAGLVRVTPPPGVPSVSKGRLWDRVYSWFVGKG